MSVTAWKNSSPAGRFGYQLESDALYPEDFGGIGGGVLFDNATAINAACDLARGHGTVVSLKRNPPYYFSNILVSANMSLEGPSMNTVCLARLPGSTGPAITEKTAAQGNSSGATGLWLRNFSLRGYLASDPGAGGVGDQGTYGILLGNAVPNNQLNFNSGVENVHVRNFVAGTGVYVNQNAARCSYIWCVNNNIGIETHGGSGVYFALWGEGNLSQQLIISGSSDNYWEIQTEESSALETILVRGGGNMLSGLFLGIGRNKTAGVVTVDLAANAASTSIYNLRISPNGFTWPQGVYVPAWASGTGPTQQQIPFWVDANSTNYGWYFDSFSGKSFRISGAGIKEPHFVIAGDLTVEVGTTAGRGNPVIAGAGAQRFDSDLGIPIWSDGAAWKNAAGVAV